VPRRCGHLQARGSRTLISVSQKQETESKATNPEIRVQIALGDRNCYVSAYGTCSETLSALLVSQVERLVDGRAHGGGFSGPIVYRDSVKEPGVKSAWC
jgi:hypothetical protein